MGWIKEAKIRGILDNPVNNNTIYKHIGDYCVFSKISPGIISEGGLIFFQSTLGAHFREYMVLFDTVDFI